METSDSAGDVTNPTLSTAGSKSNTRQRKAPKPPRCNSEPSPVLKRLENSKPAPLQLDLSSGTTFATSAEPITNLDSSKPVPVAATLERDRDTDLAAAAAVAASILSLITAFLDMDIIIIQAVHLMVPVPFQAQTLAWARSANLEVALWTSCSVVQACLVWSIFAALFGAFGVLAGLPPGAAAGGTVAITRFGHKRWAAGTLLGRMTPRSAVASTVVVACVSMGLAYFLERRRNSLDAQNGVKRGWTSTWNLPSPSETLLSLRISPVTCCN